VSTDSSAADLFSAFQVTPNPNPRSPDERAEILASPGFGQHFSDHMVRISWEKERSWHDAQVLPYGPISLNPAASVLHYGQEVFEGLKAYRHADGSIWAFRPEANGRRLQRSAQRLALPELPLELFIASLKHLIKIDHNWVAAPSGGESSLYLRPFLIGDEAYLGVRASHTASYYLIASPAGTYFSSGIAPVSIWLADNYARAAGKGGTGAAKCGGNYAASLLPQIQAQAQGCSQVLFLDSVEGRYLEELGGMNVFLVYGQSNTLVTPALTGSFLEGITRDSLLQLARDQGMHTEERKIPLSEWVEGVQSGEITEIFACGTAAIITPISQLKGDNLSVGEANAAPGPVSLSLRQALTDIQYGRAPDPHGWMQRLDA